MEPENVKVSLNYNSKDTSAIVEFDHPQIFPDDYIICEVDGKIPPAETHKKNFFILTNLSPGTIHQFTVQSVANKLRSKIVHTNLIQTCKNFAT